MLAIWLLRRREEHSRVPFGEIYTTVGGIISLAYRYYQPEEDDEEVYLAVLSVVSLISPQAGERIQRRTPNKLGDHLDMLASPWFRVPLGLAQYVDERREWGDLKLAIYAGELSNRRPKRKYLTD